MTRKSRSRILLACLVMAAGNVAAGAQEAPVSLLRAALLVGDADRSITFYGLLGFQIESDVTSPRKADGNPFPLNRRSSQTRLVILRNTADQGGRIGLVEFSKPQPAAARSDRKRVGIGDVVLVFDVADADAIHATLAAAKASVIEPPQVYVSRRTDANGRALRGKVFHAHDPDGYLVELLEAAK